MDRTVDDLRRGSRRAAGPLWVLAALLGAGACFDLPEKREEDAGTDAGGDADSDTDADSDSDTGQSLAPAITGIDGAGSLRGVVAPDGVPDEYGVRVDAAHRFRNHWWITGARLDEVTAVNIEQDSERFELAFDEGATAMSGRVTLPEQLAAGLVTLTLVSAGGDASAQLYVLQGEPGERGEKGDKGDPGDSQLACDTASGACTLDANLEVTGDVTAHAGVFQELDADTLTVNASYWLPECPQGYARDVGAAGIVLCRKGLDEVVKVGNFWMDRYEASVWPNADCTSETTLPFWRRERRLPGRVPGQRQLDAPRHRRPAAGVCLRQERRATVAFSDVVPGRAGLRAQRQAPVQQRGVASRGSGNGRSGELAASLGQLHRRRCNERKVQHLLYRRARHGERRLNPGERGLVYLDVGR